MQLNPCTPIKESSVLSNFTNTCTGMSLSVVTNPCAAAEGSETVSSASVAAAAPRLMGRCQASIVLYHPMI